MISVLGAGVAGLCAATAISDRGLDVEVIVPEGSPPPVSRLAGGMLAPFCEGESAPETVVARGQKAVDWWADHVRGVEKRGTLVVAAARDGAELDRFSRATRQHTWVSPAEMEPALETRFSRGLFFEAEAHMNPVEALADLRRSLVSRGVRIHEQAPSGQIVDCRGLAARGHLPDLRAVRGEMLKVHAPDVELTRPIRLLHPRFPCYIVPHAPGLYMIGATMVESANAGGISVRAVMELLSAAYTVHPGFAEAEVMETGAGLRPAFPDNIPAIRSLEGAIHLNGMYRHGFLMAPILAEELAQKLAEASGQTQTRKHDHAC